MVEHLVWFKMKDDVSSSDTTAMLETLRALPAAIPEIEYLACGEDFSGRSNGYQIGLVVRFANRAAHDDVYQPHPVHQEFITKFRHLWADVKALDFEC